jgi:hypothetical protein
VSRSSGFDLGCVIETKQSEKRKDEIMSRFEDTEAALTERLRAMKAKPEMTINLFDIGVPLTGCCKTTRHTDEFVIHWLH